MRGAHGMKGELPPLLVIFAVVQGSWGLGFGTFKRNKSAMFDICLFDCAWPSGIKMFSEIP